MSTTEPPPHPEPARDPGPHRPGWRERTWGLPVLVATALLALLLGGLGGAGLAAVADDDGFGRGDGWGRMHDRDDLPPGQLRREQRLEERRDRLEERMEERMEERLDRLQERLDEASPSASPTPSPTG